jgi:hypothetical protein
LVELEKITSSREPDQEQQRRQRVYRQLGVQQALVLVQNLNEIRKHSRYISVENILRPFWSLTYLLLTFVLTNHGFQVLFLRKTSLRPELRLRPDVQAPSHGHPDQFQ